MIGTILKELRQSKDYTIAQLCELIQMNTNTYAKYEREERDVSTETLAKFADFYGVTTDYLLGREPYNDPFTQLCSLLGVSQEEKQMLSNYFDIPKEDRLKIIQLLSKITSTD